MIKIPNTDLCVGQIVTVAVCDRICDADGSPLGDTLVGTADCRILSVGAHWSDQPRGLAGRWYDVEPLMPIGGPRLPATERILGLW